MTMREQREPPADFPVDRETLAYLVVKARAYDGLVAPDDPSDASNAADDRFMDALEDEADNPVGAELRAAIDALDSDGQRALVALAWIGRGDYEATEWVDALTTARERAENSAARYLMGMPLLGDYLETGADALGVSLTAEQRDGLGDPDIDTRGG